MASMRKLYDGLTVLMNYLPDDEDNALTFARGRFWAEGPTPCELDEGDGEQLTGTGWSWNDIRKRWEF